jgi:hypothetical protein
MILLLSPLAQGTKFIVGRSAAIFRGKVRRTGGDQRHGQQNVPV